jgi:hypothetical protein
LANVFKENLERGLGAVIIRSTQDPTKRTDKQLPAVEPRRAARVQQHKLRHAAARNNTIWMHWRCVPGIVHCNAAFNSRICFVAYLTIRPPNGWSKQKINRTSLSVALRHPKSLGSIGSRTIVSAMVRLGVRVMRQLRRRMIIWALDAVSPDGEDCCHALLPARVIAGPGAASDVTSAQVDRAPWIRISRLRIARLRFAQQRSGNDKKHDDQHARHSPSPYRRCRLPSLSVLLRRRTSHPLGRPDTRSGQAEPQKKARVG